MNYLQNKYNTLCHFLQNSLHYRVKHKSFKKLQLLYQFLMTELCRTFMITLWTVKGFRKRIPRNWNKNRFTASMIAQSISILSLLKMSSFSPYAGAKKCSPSMRWLCIRVVHCAIPGYTELIHNRDLHGPKFYGPARPDTISARPVFPSTILGPARPVNM